MRIVVKRRFRDRPDSIGCQVAYYGNLFRNPDEQGTGDDPRDWTAEQTALADVLALEWLERLAERVPEGSRDSAQARLLLEIVRDPMGSNAQGAGKVLGGVLNTLARAPWLAHTGMWVAERFLKAALTQVTRYLTDDEVREQARQAVRELITPETKVLLGHTLGSVVAYECAHELTHRLPLLVKLGSSLGLRTIVTDCLRPPPSFPPGLTDWLNVANRDDLVAAEPDLRPLFTHEIPNASRFAREWFQGTPGDPHSVETYLGREAVGRAVIHALD